MTSQFGRKAELFIGQGGNGIVISDLHFMFEIRQSETPRPNNAIVRVYNLSRETAERIKSSEFTRMAINAGYEDGNYGLIFLGTIVQVFTGLERNVDSFVEIFAADGDEFANFATVNTTLAKGATPQQINKEIFERATIEGRSVGDLFPYAIDSKNYIGGVNPAGLQRAKVMFGMARNYADDWARLHGARWSVQNGEIVIYPVDGYRPGEAVVLSPATGLIGVPEATADGVHVRCLLNPKIRIGCLVQIARDDISALTVKNIPLGRLTTGSIPTAAITTAEGFYRVMVAEFTGDTRGQAWYCEMVLIAVDVTQPINKSVKVEDATVGTGQ